MPLRVSRREALETVGIMAAGLFAGVRRSRAASTAAPRIEVEEASMISRHSSYYHGWPTLARRNSGELLLVCSGGREAHVCPFGRVELIRSKDDGRTWSFPRVLFDGPIDDRDAGVLETAQGTLLVTTFTSLAFEPTLVQAEVAGPSNTWPAERLARWQAGRDRISAEQRQRSLGVWMLRSTDDGLSWTGPDDCLVNSPHGPVPLSDGRLLYAGKDLWREPHRVGVCESADDGQTWRWLADIPVRSGDDHNNYHELHAVETDDGRIVVHIRNHNRQHYRETLQTESDDGGKTWSTPHAIGVWGLPSHLTRLAGGRLLMTYGHRRAPFGNQARLSDDGGRTWSAPLIISADGAGGDLGYPSTVQFDDGSLLTAWYELLPGSARAVLRQARWKIAA